VIQKKIVRSVSSDEDSSDDGSSEEEATSLYPWDVKAKNRAASASPPTDAWTTVVKSPEAGTGLGLKQMVATPSPSPSPAASPTSAIGSPGTVASIPNPARKVSKGKGSFGDSDSSDDADEEDDDEEERQRLKKAAEAKRERERKEKVQLELEEAKKKEEKDLRRLQKEKEKEALREKKEQEKREKKEQKERERQTLKEQRAKVKQEKKENLKKEKERLKKERKEKEAREKEEKNAKAAKAAEVARVKKEENVKMEEHKEAERTAIKVENASISLSLSPARSSASSSPSASLSPPSSSSLPLPSPTSSSPKKEGEPESSPRRRGTRIPKRKATEPIRSFASSIPVTPTSAANQTKKKVKAEEEVSLVPVPSSLSVKQLPIPTSPAPMDLEEGEVIDTPLRPEGRAVKEEEVKEKDTTSPLSGKRKDRVSLSSPSSSPSSSASMDTIQTRSALPSELLAMSKHSRLTSEQKTAFPTLAISLREEATRIHKGASAEKERNARYYQELGAVVKLMDCADVYDALGERGKSKQMMGTAKKWLEPIRGKLFKEPPPVLLSVTLSLLAYTSYHTLEFDHNTMSKVNRSRQTEYETMLKGKAPGDEISIPFLQLTNLKRAFEKTVTLTRAYAYHRKAT